MSRTTVLSILGASLALAGAADAAVIFLNTSSKLAAVDLATGEQTLIGSFGLSGGEKMTDIAFDQSGNLWGVSFNKLYSIDPLTAETTLLGAHGIGAANALEVSPEGELLAASSGNRNLYAIDTETLATENLGSMGMKSSGDLAFHDGSLYMMVMRGGGDDLAMVDPGGPSVSASVIGRSSLNYAYGLASDGQTLFAAHGSGVFEIDPSTASSTQVADVSLSGFGSIWGATIQIPGPASTGALIAAGSFLMIRRRRTG